MAIIPVSQLKYGDRLSEDVLTSSDHVLFYKRRMIEEKELEILNAFMITNVSIEPRQGGEQPVAEEQVKTIDRSKSSMLFYKEYDKTLQLLKRVFNLAYTGGSFPILEIRHHAESLLSQIDSYNILTYSPRNLNIQEYVYHNSIQVSLTSYILARWHGFLQKDLIPIALGGLLYNIGNAKIDPTILEKPTKLTSSEFEEMKKHTIYGYQVLKSVPAINDGVKFCALQHHEREDGSGYPLGLKGEKIHPYAKVIAIADMFHSMTSNRQHQQAASPYLVLEQLYKESFGKLDPALVQTFIQKATQFLNGTLVKLSDNRIGEIVFTEQVNPTRPMVNVNGTIINLAKERQLYIKSIVRS
jgi:HD-GYP domain-containing protein (c-di-GMP phosphodiesterase class II)